MTSTYVHAYMALHAYSNQMLTKSLTDSIARYAAARQTKSNRRSPIAGLWSKMHTTGSIDCFKILKFAATSFMNTYFEQVIERDLAGQDAFLVLIWHMPDTAAERAV